MTFSTLVVCGKLISELSPTCQFKEVHLKIIEMHDAPCQTPVRSYSQDDTSPLKVNMALYSLESVKASFRRAREV